MDGSPEPYAKALLAGGIVQQNVDRRAFKLVDPIFVSEGVSSIAALPPILNKVAFLFSALLFLNLRLILCLELHPIYPCCR